MADSIERIADEMKRLAASPQQEPGACPHIMQSKEGTAYCRLAESAGASGGGVECPRCDGEGTRWNNAAMEVTQCGRCKSLGKIAERVESLLTAWGDGDERDKRDAIAAELRQLAAAPQQEPGAVPSDDELTGMWERADLIGGATDCVTPADESGAVGRAFTEEVGRDDKPTGYFLFESAPSGQTLAGAGGDADALEFFPIPAGLHPHTVNLVARFAAALADKLAGAERKYGYSDGWASPDWMDECRAKLLEHVGKGDPRDVAAYCAFLWHHHERTTLTATSAGTREGGDLSLVPMEARPGACRHDWSSMSHRPQFDYCTRCGVSRKAARLSQGGPDNG